MGGLLTRLHGTLELRVKVVSSNSDTHSHTQADVFGLFGFCFSQLFSLDLFEKCLMIFSQTCTYMPQNTPEPSSCSFLTAFLTFFSLRLVSLYPVGPHRLLMQNDGNLVLYDSVNAVVSEIRVCVHADGRVINWQSQIVRWSIVQLFVLCSLCDLW